MFPYPNLLKDLPLHNVHVQKILFETFTDFVDLMGIGDQKVHYKIATTLLLNILTYFVIHKKTLKNKPSYLTEAWLPEEEELFDNKGVGLSNDRCLGFDDGSGSVCV